ncbi:MAG: serine/threonine-protein kinase, partial [Fimbriiglobus sp.]
MVGQESATAFLSRVTACGLLPPERVAGCPGRSPDDAAAELVRHRLLTPFQARQMLNGRAAALFPTPKFKVLDILGEGGMGRVLLCEHLVLQKLVAVKELHPSALSPDEAAGGPFGRNESGYFGAVERFLREARAAAALDHPNIVRVLDVDTTGRLPLIVMEFVDGTDLHTLVADLPARTARRAGRSGDPGGVLAVERVASYVRQTAAALAHADAAGLVHRDIKPGNLMLDRAGRVRVIDFGLSRTGAADDWDERFLLGTADF